MLEFLLIILTMAHVLFASMALLDLFSGSQRTHNGGWVLFISLVPLVGIVAYWASKHSS